MADVKRWYNRYNYFAEPIYNPFDILLFIGNGFIFDNYWRETGNPSFLIDILKEDLESFMNTLKSLLSSIPYNNYVKNEISSYEGYYASVIYSFLSSLGYDTTAEDMTSNGRIDLTLKIKFTIYMFEFKWEKIQ